MFSFAKQKSDILKKNDKSSIGKIDKPILALCKKINSLDNFYTTSSCSGRVVLIKNKARKGPDLFILRTHEKISPIEIKKAVKNSKYSGLVLFKQEPPILHISCDTLENANLLLKKANISGWKNCGAIGISNRITIELRSTENISLPLAKNRKLLVSSSYLAILAKEANKKLKSGWEKINKLEKAL